MKTITIQIKNETAEALDKAIQSQYYYNYPIEQAYSLFIDELVLEIQKLPLCSCCTSYCCVSEHQHLSAWLSRKKE